MHAYHIHVFNFNVHLANLYKYTFSLRSSGVPEIYINIFRAYCIHFSDLMLTCVATRRLLFRENLHRIQRKQKMVISWVDCKKNQLELWLNQTWTIELLLFCVSIDYLQINIYYRSDTLLENVWSCSIEIILIQNNQYKSESHYNLLCKHHSFRHKYFPIKLKTLFAVRQGSYSLCCLSWDFNYFAFAQKHTKNRVSLSVSLGWHNKETRKEIQWKNFTILFCTFHLGVKMCTSLWKKSVGDISKQFI